MFHYEFRQWLSFFYLYCIFGWCFESTYVSLKQHCFVNRGFLKGLGFLYMEVVLFWYY